ncbi:MAG: cytochrome c oxidase subunit II [Acidimicrobiales bacterium]
MRAIVAFALTVALAGCGSRFGQPHSVTEEGAHTLTLWRGFFVTACAVGGLVLGLILFAAVRFRRRSDDIPSQKPYNIPWEIAYTVTPVLVVSLLFGFSVAAQGKLDRTVAKPDLTVNVVAFQWGWQFQYPDRNVTITGSAEGDAKPALVLPVGKTTRLVLTTTDVIHSFWVPAFLQKRDMIPGVDNAINVTPTDVGTYDGKCAEYCALDHWRMTFTLEVVPPEQLDAAVDAAASSSPRS